MSRVLFTKNKGGWVKRRAKRYGFDNKLKTFFHDLTAGVVKGFPFTYEQFLLQCNARKRDLYVRAVESILDIPLNGKDYVRKAFVKVEKYIKPTNPRVIQAATERAHVSWGRFIQSVEKKLYKRIDKIFGYKTVMKGYDLDTIASIIAGHWSSIVDARAVSFDQIRFDSHVHGEAQRWKHTIYRKFLHLQGNYKKDFEEFADSQIRGTVHGYVREGKFIYSLDGQLASGDMDTSLTANLINAGMVYSFFKHREVPYRFFVNGDDACVIIGKRNLHHLSQFEEWVSSCGFACELEKPVKHIQQLKFCQNYVIYDDISHKWRSCRDVVAACKKDLCCGKNMPSSKKLNDVYHSTAVGGLAVYGHMPILGSLYKKLLTLFPHGEVTLDNLSWNMRNEKTLVMEYRTPTQDMRNQFFLSTGIPPAVQEEVEALYEGASVNVFFEELASSDLYSFSLWKNQ